MAARKHDKKEENSNETHSITEQQFQHEQLFTSFATEARTS